MPAVEDTWAELEDEAGRVVLEYRRTTLGGHRAADEAHVPAGVGLGDAVRAVLVGLPGWVVAGDGPLLPALVDAGAAVRRHASTWTWDLDADPPPAAWADPSLAPGLRLLPIEGWTPEQLAPTAALAYPPGHPDHVEDERALLTEIMVDEQVGPLLPCSAVVVEGERVVATLLVTDNPSPEPFGGPWVSDVHRVPGAAHRGLGSLLLRRALRLLHEAGRARLGLAVTAGNPAEAVYAHLGFRTLSRGMSVVVPG